MRSSEVRYSLKLYIIFSLGIWGWMVLVRKLLPVAISFSEKTQPYLGIMPEKNGLLEVWQRWDVLQYQYIAIHGYNAANIKPFGPLFPFLMHWVAYLVGNNTLIAGLVISSLFCLAAIIAFMFISRLELGIEEHSKQAMLYLVLFPTSFFLFAPYTESIFLFGAIMTIYALRKKRWISAGLWGMMAASVRLPAILLIIPALYESCMEWQKSKVKLVWISPLLILIGAGIFPLYIFLVFKLPFWELYKNLETSFHRDFSIPGLNLFYSIRNMLNGISPLINIPDLMIMVLFMVGIVIGWKKLPFVYTVYNLAFIMLYLSTTTSQYPLMSISRYVLVFFPVFITLPSLVKRKEIRLVILILFLMGLLFYSAQFAIWGWAG